MVCYHSIVGPMVDNHQKPSKQMVAWPQNHQKTIEPNGCPKPFCSMVMNHWNFAMVVKCDPKSPNSFDFVYRLQNDMGTLAWSGRFICPLSLSSSLFVRKFKMWRLRAFLGLSNGPKPLLTIVSDFGENHWKTIDVNGQSVKKHSMVMVQW